MVWNWFLFLSLYLPYNNFPIFVPLFEDMVDVAKDLFCGWCSGIGQVLTMMPFENIKIKLVSKPQ